MAIRAVELNLPAVVGAGEQLYESLANASVIEIDASNKQIKIIK